MTETHPKNEMPRESESKKDPAPPKQHRHHHQHNNHYHKHKHIRFGTIHLRLYPIILGDNPSAKGPPIQLDWTPLEPQFSWSLDEYEGGRLAERREEFLLAAGTRRTLLRHTGYSNAEIGEAVRLAEAVNRKRQETIAHLERAGKEEEQEERRANRRRRWWLFGCQNPEPHVLIYPTNSTVVAPPFLSNHDTLQPMFDRIPCTHCAILAGTGPGCDEPARVGMFRCDGTTCRQQQRSNRSLYDYRGGSSQSLRASSTSRRASSRSCVVVGGGIRDSQKLAVDPTVTASVEEELTPASDISLHDDSGAADVEV